MNSQELKVVLIGGSFNPPTFSHLQMGKFLYESNKYDKIIYLPCGFRKDKPDFQSNSNRLKMLKLGINEFFKKEAFSFNSEVEQNLEKLKPKLLIDVYELEESDEMVKTGLILERYENKFKNIKLFFSIGSDLLSSLKNWDFYESILKNKNFIIFERDNYPIENFEIPPYSNLVFGEVPKNLSSTKIRNIIHSGGKGEILRKLKEFTVLSVIEFILENKLYFIQKE